MKSYILFTFALLGWVFYVASGGQEFTPESREVVAMAATPSAPVAIESDSIHLAAAEVTAPIALPFASLTPVVVPDVVTPLPELVLMQVAGSRVNMRDGPGTSYTVVATLNGGTLAEVLDDSDGGWLRIRIVDTNQIGWMSKRLLSAANS